MRPHHLQFTSETFSGSDSAVDIDKSVRVQKWSKITDGLKLVLNSKSSLLFLKVSIWSQTHFYSDWSRDYKSRTTQRPHVILIYKISLHLCLLHQMLTPLEDWTFKLGSIALKPWSWSTLIWDTTWAHCVYFLLWDVPVFCFFYVSPHPWRCSLSQCDIVEEPERWPYSGQFRNQQCIGSLSLHIN